MSGQCSKEVIDKWETLRKEDKSTMITEFAKANFSIDSEYFTTICQIGSIVDSGKKSHWLSRKDRSR